MLGKWAVVSFFGPQTSSFLQTQIFFKNSFKEEGAEMEQATSRIYAIVSLRLEECFLPWRTGWNKSVVPPNLASTLTCGIRISRERFKFQFWKKFQNFITFSVLKISYNFNKYLFSDYRVSICFSLSSWQKKKDVTLYLVPPFLVYVYISGSLWVPQNFFGLWNAKL